MSPTLEEGDFVLCSRWPGMSIKENDLIVLYDPKFSRLVKRIVEINSAGHIKVAGDHPQSEHYDFWFSPRRVIGKVLFRFAKNLT